MEFVEKRHSWKNQSPPEHRLKNGFFLSLAFKIHLGCALFIVHLLFSILLISIIDS